MSEAKIIQTLINGENDLNWFDLNLNRLQTEYNNKFIAFQNEKIIESDPNFDNLMIKLKQKKIDTSNILVKFVSKVKFIL